MLTTEPLLLSLGILLVGLIAGVILFRADFCMVAMLRDFFLFRHTALLRAFVLYLLAAILLFHLGVAGGLLPLYPPPTFHAASVATIVGGLVFGIGMVLAGGCVFSTLYKMASGNLTNWIAFFGILAGSMLYAEIHPWVSEFAARTTVTAQVTLAQDAPGLRVVLLAVIVVGGALLAGRWIKQDRIRVVAYAEGYLQPWKAVLGLGMLNFFYYALAGAPFGVTTAYAKLAAYLERLVWPEHVASLDYFTTDSIHWQWGDAVISGGAAPRLDYIAFTEGALVVGVFTGALMAAVYYREFKIYGLPPWRQSVSALTGGILLALGARIAGGCNVKFFLGGLPLLAWQGIYFTLAATAGCYVGTKILTRYIVQRPLRAKP